MAKPKPQAKKKVATRGRPRSKDKPVRKFKIDKNVPIPSHARGSLRNQLPLDDMKPGESFRVVHDEARWKSITSMLASLRNYCYQHEENFVARIVKEDVEGNGDMVDVVRIWRTET